MLPGLLAASHLLELHQTEKPAALNAQLSKFLRSAGTMLLSQQEFWNGSLIIWEIPSPSQNEHNK